MNLNEDYIIDMNVKIKKDLLFMNRQSVSAKYSEFEEKYPKIFLSILDGIFDEEQFKKMIEVRKMSFEKHSDKEYSEQRMKSDIEVGELLARSFLYPVLGEPTKEQKQKAYRKVLAKSKMKNLQKT